MQPTEVVELSECLVRAIHSRKFWISWIDSYCGTCVELFFISFYVFGDSADRILAVKIRFVRLSGENASLFERPRVCARKRGVSCELYTGGVFLESAGEFLILFCTRSLSLS